MMIPLYKRGPHLPHKGYESLAELLPFRCPVQSLEKTKYLSLLFDGKRGYAVNIFFDLKIK
jgi:hypothetical protein